MQEGGRESNSQSARISWDVPTEKKLASCTPKGSMSKELSSKSLFSGSKAKNGSVKEGEHASKETS